VKRDLLLTKEVWLKCSECSNIFKIRRVRARCKPKGHVKHLWCYKCKKETAHIENTIEWEVEWEDFNKLEGGEK